jgi:outer membrane receptor protein involved in Fe transport
MTLSKKVSLTLSLLVSVNFLVAQNATIRGVVVEKTNRLPVEFASVAVLKLPDSTLVTGILTDSIGSYKIPKIDIGNYLLKVVSIGYQTSYSSFTICNKNQQTTIDSIYLSNSSKLLGEVLVKTQSNNITNKLDKQTYKANQFESAKGGNATDVLKNLPSVSVNSAGEISMRGSTGFLVLINGKPVLTDAQTLLSQLPANSIENIELITAPSAKYDADGKGGIINITTKKGTTNGVAFLVNTLAGLPSTTNYDNLENPVRFGGDATLNYKTNKWDITISGNYTRNDANGKREGDAFTKNYINNIITRFPSAGERSYDRYNYGLRTNVSYTPTKNDVFNVGFFASKKYQQRRADIVYRNSRADLTSGDTLSEFTYFNSNLQNKEGKFILGSFDYIHSFENNSKLSASVIYENANLYGNTINKNVGYPNKTEIFQVVTNPYTNPINGYRVKLDYSTTIGTGKLETGYQFRWDKQDGKFDYTVIPTTHQPDSAKFRGTVKSTNQINGVYAQYSNKVSKLQYTAGLRYEYATREVNLSSSVTPLLLNISNFFPSTNLLYTINNELTIKAGYSKRVQRNNNFELNPIPEREHSETLEQGDPNLLPQFIDLIESGINYTFKNGSFFTTLYYQNIKNPIQRVNSVYTDTILNRLFTNAEKARQIGLELGITVKVNKWFTSYLGANIYNYKISGALDILGEKSIVNNANWVYSINMNNTFDLGKNWSLQANCNYLSNRPTAQGEDSRFFSPNTSIKKIYSNGKYSMGLQWQNMNLGFMNANQQRITTWGTNFYTTTNYVYETDVFLLNFSINLNRLNSKTKLPSSELGEKEF